MELSRASICGFIIFGIGALPTQPALAGAAREASSVYLVRDAKDPRWVHGTVQIAAQPDSVIARVENVPTWPVLFSDVKSLKVVRHDGRYWHLRLDTKTMDCGEHDYYVRFEKNRTMRLRIDAPGINANGVLRVQSARTGGSTTTFSLFIETTGVIGWLIPEKTVRKRQEAMVRTDLADLAKSFAPRG